MMSMVYDQECWPSLLADKYHLLAPWAAEAKEWSGCDHHYAEGMLLSCLKAPCPCLLVEYHILSNSEVDCLTNLTWYWRADRSRSASDLLNCSITNTVRNGVDKKYSVESRRLEIDKIGRLLSDNYTVLEFNIAYSAGRKVFNFFSELVASNCAIQLQS